MGSKAKDKLNRQATSKEGEVGRLQQRGSVPAASLVSPHTKPTSGHRRQSVGSSYQEKNTTRYKPDTVLAKTQPAITFWGSSHKYIT